MRRRLVAGLLALAAVGCVVGCDVGSVQQQRRPPEPGVPVPAAAQEAVVVRLVDGDTVVLRGRGTGPLRGEARVRVLLIDTPEVHGGRDECFGEEASRRAGELLPAGARVRVEADERARDRFDRPLLHVWTEDGVNVGEALVREGYAEVLHLRPNDRYLEQFEAAEAEARQAGRGLWTAC